MASNRVWNLMYVAGNTDRIVSDSANPQDRAGALGGAATVAGNGWRTWVEHKDTGKRIFESEKEIACHDASPEPVHITSGTKRRF